MAVIRIENLRFAYASGFKLESISLTIDKGEVVTLLGPNGSGKTTLLKCINALLKPELRCVYIDGKDVLKVKRDELARLIGYVPQSHNPPFPYTVFDVVLMGRAPHLGIFQQPSKRDYEKAEFALKLVGIGRLRDRAYTEISGGERQLALIARALAQEPAVLLLDEPTAHLDFKNQILVLRTIRRVMSEKGIAVVMSLHDPNLALLFSDSVALMNNGRIEAFGNPGEVITNENIEKVYGIDIEIVEHNGAKLVFPLKEVVG